MSRVQFATIDEYIKSFPKDVQDTLQDLRENIKKEVPGAEETISYGVPTFKLNGKYVVYFAGFKKHISIYPVTTPVEKSLKEVAQYRTGKGTLQFPMDKPLPFPLIRKIVKILVKENEKRSKKVTGK